MGYHAAMFSGMLSALFAGQSYYNFQNYYNRLNAITEAILYRASEINPQVVEEAIKRGQELAQNPDGLLNLGAAFLSLAAAGIVGAYAVYEITWKIDIKEKEQIKPQSSQ